jgi:hypothetical protein
MAIDRTQYITVAELNEILGVSTYTNDDLISIYEASEFLEYFMNDPYNEYDTSDAPTNLKLATAYQVEYMASINDNSYDTSNEGFSLGKFSLNGASDSKINGEYKKISPKSRRYLVEGGLTRRIL